MLLAKSELAVCSWDAGPGKPIFTQLANSLPRHLGWRRSGETDFANRSTTRGARTIMGRKFGTGILLPEALWFYFLSRSTARGARTIMARKLGIGMLLAVTLRLYFRSRVRTFAEVKQNVPHAHVG